MIQSVRRRVRTTSLAALLLGAGLLGPGTAFASQEAAVQEAAADPAAAAEPAPHPLAAFVGDRWSVRGVLLETGERFEADMTYTPLFGGTAYHERIVVRMTADGTQTGFVYETFFGAVLEDGGFGFVTVGSDGTIMEGRGQRIEGGFTASTDRRTDDQPVGHRTMTVMPRGDLLRWRIERGQGEERFELMNAVARTGGFGSLAIPAVDGAPGPVESLRPFMGSWTTDARWNSGQRLVGRNTFRMGRGSGYAAADTFAKDGDGPEYHRYASLYVQDPEGGLTAYSVDFTGRLDRVRVTLEDRASGPALTIRNRMELEGAVAEVDQTSAISGPDTFEWLVRSRQVAADGTEGPWTTMMDATWRRGSAVARPAGTQPVVADEAAREAEGTMEPDVIDPELFDVRGDAGRSFMVERVVLGRPDDCFRLWTTAEGVREFMGVGATIDLSVGGVYEWIMLPDAPEGERGSEGCQVLAFVPDRMLSFTWNAPPSQPESRARRTWVTLTFTALEPAADGVARTAVRLDHLGFGEAAHWRETEAYFREAWTMVLDRMAEHMSIP